jgi:hypothetical protein
MCSTHAVGCFADDFDVLSVTSKLLVELTCRPVLQMSHLHRGILVQYFKAFLALFFIYFNHVCMVV